MSDTAPSLDQVRREIDEEVRAKRASGALPPSLERELDLAFDKFAPVGALDNDFGEALKAADRAAFVNVAVPTASSKPGVSFVKRLLRKAMAWYLNYLAQQVTAFGSATVRALRALGERLGAIEAQIGEVRPAVDDGSERPPVAPDLSEWVELVVARMNGARGRVLHAECGDGAMLRALTAAGVDAYGVDPRGPLVDGAVAAGGDAWPDDPLAHLGAVADHGLGGLILSGCVDRLSLARQRSLVELAARKLAGGAPLVLIGTDPRAWERVTPALEADLAPGRPLHSATWQHLLERAGFAGVAVTDGRVEGLERVPDSAAGAAVINANLDKLGQALFGPATFAVAAVRST
ncbi:MAG TPA: hypothetical protein VFA11_19040 [Acidimicrobiales bacterium]|nr:hypothetical protein [Acidimicrobiales bacterium]